MSLLYRRYVLFIFIFAGFIAGCSRAGHNTDIEKRNFESTAVMEDEWMGVYYEGKKIGYIHTTTEDGLLDGRPSNRIKSHAMVEMNISGENSVTKLDQTAYLDENGLMLSFEYDQSIMGHRMFVRGERRDDKLVVAVNAGGDERKRSFPFSKNLYTSALLKHALLKRGLFVGDEMEFSLFLEPLLAVAQVKIRVVATERGFVEGKETDIYTVEESFKGIKGSLLITAEGLTLEEVSPNGFKLLRESEEEAKAEVKPLSITDFLLASRIEIERPLENPRSLKKLKLKIMNVPESFAVIDDDHQKVVKVEKEGEGMSYTFSINVKEPPEYLPEEKDLLLPLKGDFSRYLASDHVINADNAIIVKRSKKIVDGEKAAFKAVQKIYDWVFNNIDKKLIDTVSAVDTLKSGEGECQAHANLFAALARAAGIPTKVISGIVYSEDFGGFMYHAWNEVYLGQWISVDPTMGEFPADATHLKLAEGGMEEQIKIMALVGKVKAEILN